MRTIDRPETTSKEPDGDPSAAPGTRRVEFDVSGWGVAKLMAGLLLLGVVGNVAYQIRDVFIWTAAALFLAIALNPLVARLEPRLGRTASAIVVFIGFLVVLIATLTALVAPFVSQVDELTTGLPTALEDARHNHTFARLDSRFHLVEHARAHADAVPGYVFGTAGTVLGGVVAVTTTLFLMIFLLIELPNLCRLVLGQLQPAQRERAVAIAQHANRQVGGYVFGNLLISVICGAVTWVALYAFGVPYSLALAVFMAVFDIIPLVGATIGSIVVIGAALLLTGTTAGIAMFVIVMIYQQIENHVLQPLIYGRTVALSSLTVLLAVLIGGDALGLIGALLAIPIAGTLQAVVGEMLEKRADRIQRGGPTGEEAVESS